MTPLRPMPEDFPVVRNQMGAPELLAHYKVSGRTVARWVKDAGLPPKNAHPYAKPVPDDFHSVAPRMHKKDMMAHYRVSQTIVDRWLRETGLESKPYKRTYKLAGHKCDIPKPKRDSEHDMAAEYLRRFGPVNRCDERGRYAQSGDYFRVGRAVMTFAQVIEKAERLKARRMEMA